MARFIKEQCRAQGQTATSVTKVTKEFPPPIVTLVTYLTLYLFRRIQRSPEIPGRNGAIRPPLLAVLHQLFRRGKFPFAKSFGEAFLYA
ncbi:MAG: hypothetical protein QOF94_1762, partial [Acidobacteriaceae bacterium]